MIEAQIHFIENKHLLVLSSDNCAELTVCLSVIDLNASELRVLDPNIYSTHREGDSMGLVGL